MEQANVKSNKQMWNGTSKGEMEQAKVKSNKQMWNRTAINLRLVTCLCMSTEAAQSVGLQLKFVNILQGGESHQKSAFNAHTELILKQLKILKLSDIYLSQLNWQVYVFF